MKGKGEVRKEREKEKEMQRVLTLDELCGEWSQERKMENFVAMPKYCN